MPSSTIRAPRPDEAEILADLHLRTWAETYGHVFPPSAWDASAREERLRLWTAICTAPRETDRIAVADRDGVPVGFAGSGLDRVSPPDRQLFFIYLLASEHGTGTGQRLLDHVLDDERTSLWVLERNARACAFYRRNGFLADGVRRPTGYDAGGDEIRLVRLRFSAPPPEPPA